MTETRKEAFDPRTLTAARLAKKSAREAERIACGIDCWVYPDSPPGVGWVAEVPGKAKRYYATKTQALERVRGAVG